jgi:hypothetical protein
MAMASRFTIQPQFCSINIDPSNTGSNYQLFDKAYVESQKEGLLSHIDIKVGTGLAARQRMRFSRSYFIWECNPSTNSKCKIAVNSKGADSCYCTAGAATFEAMVAADKNEGHKAIQRKPILSTVYCRMNLCGRGGYACHLFGSRMHAIILMDFMWPQRARMPSF